MYFNSFCFSHVFVFCKNICNIRTQWLNESKITLILFINRSSFLVKNNIRTLKTSSSSSIPTINSKGFNKEKACFLFCLSPLLQQLCSIILVRFFYKKRILALFLSLFLLQYPFFFFSFKNNITPLLVVNLIF